MQKLYSGVAVAEMKFRVSANDEEQAKDFIKEMASDEFKELIKIEVKDVKEDIVK